MSINLQEMFGTYISNIENRIKNEECPFLSYEEVIVKYEKLKIIYKSWLDQIIKKEISFWQLRNDEKKTRHLINYLRNKIFTFLNPWFNYFDKEFPVPTNIILDDLFNDFKHSDIKVIFQKGSEYLTKSLYKLIDEHIKYNIPDPSNISFEIFKSNIKKSNFHIIKYNYLDYYSQNAILFYPRFIHEGFHILFQIQPDLLDDLIGNLNNYKFINSTIAEEFVADIYSIIYFGPIYTYSIIQQINLFPKTIEKSYNFQRITIFISTIKFLINIVENTAIDIEIINIFKRIEKLLLETHKVVSNIENIDIITQEIDSFSKEIIPKIYEKCISIKIQPNISVSFISQLEYLKNINLKFKDLEIFFEWNTPLSIKPLIILNAYLLDRIDINKSNFNYVNNSINKYYVSNKYLYFKNQLIEINPENTKLKEFPPFYNYNIPNDIIGSTLSDSLIKKLLRDIKNGLIIHPILDEGLQIQGSKIDLRLDNKFFTIKHISLPYYDFFEEEKKYQEKVELPYGSPFYIQPGEFVLAPLFEVIRLPDNIVGRLDGRSSLGRLGISVHSTAGWVDPGYNGTITMELSNSGKFPVALYPLMRLATLTLYPIVGNVETPYYKKEKRKYGNIDEIGISAKTKLSEDIDKNIIESFKFKNKENKIEIEKYSKDWNF